MNGYELLKRLHPLKQEITQFWINTACLQLFVCNNKYFYSAKYRCIPSQIKLHEVEDYIENQLQYQKEETILYTSIEKRVAFQDQCVQVITYQQEKELQHFKDICQKDIQIANVDVYDPIIIGIYDTELIGVCSAQILYGCLDIAVIVHPNYRKRGIGTSLLMDITRRIQRSGKQPLYRIQSHNHASLAIAKKVGYETLLEETIYR